MKVELSITFTTALIIVKHLKLNPQDGYESALAYLDELHSMRMAKPSANELPMDAASTVGVMWQGSPSFQGLKLDLTRQFQNFAIDYWQGGLSDEDKCYIGPII